MRHLNNGTDHRHSKSCCDQSSPARRTTNKLRNDNVIITSKRSFDLIITFSSRNLFAGYILPPSFDHWLSNYRVVGFNAQVKIKMFWTLTLRIYPAPKHWDPLELCIFIMTNFWTRYICQLHKKIDWEIKASSLSLRLHSHMAAKAGYVYPMCLVLATNPLFMSTLLRVPYASSFVVHWNRSHQDDYLCGLVFIYTEYYAMFYSILSPKYFVFFVFQCQEAWFGERNCVLLLFFNSFTFEKPFSNMV